MGDSKHHNLFEDPMSVLWPMYWVAIFLSMVVSNSVVVFLRVNLGYRLMRLWVFWVIFFVLVGWGGLTEMVQYHTTGGWGTTLFIFYAVAMLVLAIIHRRRGWELVFRNPDAVHSMSRGDSFLAMVLPVPEWVIQRYIEPALVMLLGFFMMYGIGWTTFGLWLFCAGACLAAIEEFTLEEAINRLLDMRDGEIEAKAMADDKAAISAANKPSVGKKVGGIAVSSPELLRLRASRRAAAAAEVGVAL